MIEQFPTLCVFHNEVDICLGLDDLLSGQMYLVQLDDIGMPKDLKYADLSCDTLDISLLDYLLLLQGLDCYLLGGMDMHTHSHLAKSALTDALT